MSSSAVMDPACVHIKHESCDFLGLPGELRNRTYKECIWSQLVPGTDQIRRSNYNNLVALFTTNKQVRDELMPLVFERVVLCGVDPDMPFYLRVVRGLNNIRKAHPNLQGCLTLHTNMVFHTFTRSWVRTDEERRSMLIATLCSGRVDDHGPFVLWLPALWKPDFVDFHGQKTNDFIVHRGVPIHLRHKVQGSTARPYEKNCKFRNGENEWTYEADDRSWYMVARYHWNYDVEVIGNIGCLEQLWTCDLSGVEEIKYRHVTDAFQKGEQLRRKWSLRIQEMGAIATGEKREAS